MGVPSYLMEWTPFVAMVIVECLDVGLSTLGKAAMSRGMNHFVFVVYSNALATPILFLLTCRSTRPPFSFSLLCKFFFLGLVGITVMQNCVFTGIDYSSITLASAMSNLTPAIAFVLAVTFRMEKLEIRSSVSWIKILGAMLSISGALVVTLFKGSPISGLQIQPSPLPLSPLMLVKASNWVIGGIFLAIASSSLAIWNIAQAAVLKGYPSQLTIVAFYCLFGTIQSAILSLIVVKDPSAWKLSLDIELISILYSAIFGSVVTFSVLTWCINRKGPVFVTMFKPVGIAFSAFSSVIFLGDTLYVGSIIGALVIVIGLYTVLWAQSKELTANKGLDDNSLSSNADASPLLGSA